MKFGYVARHLPAKLLVAVGVFAGTLAMSVPASADTFNVQYISVNTSSSSNSDFHTGNVSTGTSSSNYVIGNLVDGVPVYNTSESGAVGAIDYNHTTGQLQWWTPGPTTGGVNVVIPEGTGTLAVSTSLGSPTEMWPQNTPGTNQSGYEETAILSGVFSLSSAQTVTFGMAEDDDAFIYVDGDLVGGSGGIHALGGALTDYTTSMLSSGMHTVDIFYADQDIVQAQLVITSSVPVTPTPEPGSLALLGTSVLGLAGVVRRRFVR